MDELERQAREIAEGVVLFTGSRDALARRILDFGRAAHAAGRAEGEKAARITIGQMSGGNVTGVHINLDD